MRRTFAIVAVVCSLLVASVAAQGGQPVYVPIVSVPLPTSATVLTPVSTIAPISTVVPAPTTTLPRIVVIEPTTYSYQPSGSKYVRVVGEVTNNMQEPRSSIRITINFYDAAGGLTGSDFAYAPLNNLQPGERTCFQIYTNHAGAWASYRFQSPTSYTGNPAKALTLSNVSGAYDNLGSYFVNGEIRNNTTSEQKRVSVISSFYNGAGSIVGCGRNYINADTLQPGQQSPFVIQESNAMERSIASYRIQAD